MKIGKLRLNLTSIPVIVFAVSICLTCSGNFGAKNPTEAEMQQRADIIQIDSMQQFGKLERPAVTFLHQKHTEALEKKNQDCKACHLTEKDRLVFKYMRLEDSSSQAVMDVYHTNCIACHQQTADGGGKSGPLTCGECHQERMDLTSIWEPIGMDRSLHYRHSKAQDKKCERCHHEFDEVTKKLFYAKGKEGTCRYCHQDVTVENRISLREASHIDCINCHRQTLAKFDDAGPITCGGCHDPAQQKLIERLKEVPRMQRNQPDTVFVRTSKAGITDPQQATRMKMVPFSHKSHEEYNDTCRVCHHANLNACVQCHTLQGTKEGKFVTLEESMHRLNVKMSCSGCHEINQRSPECAGCHVSIAKTRQQDPAACQACHMADVAQVAASLQQTEEKELAAMYLNAREPLSAMYPPEDIPETVEINAIKDQYAAVKLPHRKIVQTLSNNIKDNKLVAYFHADKNTLCQACHHHSPAAKKPPSCASCHGRPFDERDPNRPGLMAAYHRQCMECHEAMNLEKPVATNCVACHPKKE